MFRSSIVVFLLVLSSLSLLAQVEKSILSVIEARCVQCHGKDEKVKGKIDLLKIQSIADLQAQPELLGKLIEVIDFEEMPPEDEPQMESRERQEFLKELKATLHRSVSEQRVLAHTPMRRMNRFQYDNAVVDLFELKGVVFSLPERMMREHGNYFKPETGKMADKVTVGSRPLGKSQLIEKRLGGVAAFPQDLRAEHGYDNRGDHLSLSPLLMESFLKLGQSIVDSKDFVSGNVGVWAEFFAAPDSDLDAKMAARARLKPFLVRAFRRPVDEGLLDRYAGFVAHQLDSGVAFIDAMKSVAAAVISSPKFLYLYDESTSSDAAETV
ncbi:MAG: hypothetical protein ACI9R3_006454, partial [Verrucomicrobiales bacterium]